MFEAIDRGRRHLSSVAGLAFAALAMVSVNGYLINDRERNKRPLPPKAEHGWWYQYYFATERGRAGYAANRREFARLIWQNNSPSWAFDDATFERTAASFDNPDHVDIVIHNYRWRLSLAGGDPRYDALEQRLAEGPVITVPTITLDGDADGVAPASDGTAYARVHRPAFASHRHGGWPQPACGSPAGLRRRRHERRPLLTPARGAKYNVHDANVAGRCRSDTHGRHRHGDRDPGR